MGLDVVLLLKRVVVLKWAVGILKYSYMFLHSQNIERVACEE